MNFILESLSCMILREEWLNTYYGILGSSLTFGFFSMMLHDKILLYMNYKLRNSSIDYLRG